MRTVAVRAIAFALLAMSFAACGTRDGGSGPPGPTPTSTTAPTPPPSVTPSASESTTPPQATTPVEVYFMNPAMGDPCTEVFPVERDVPELAPLRGALEALLAGPTAAERADGFEGWFSEATAHLLGEVRLDGARALVSFDAALPHVIPNASSSCGSIGLLAQLDHTATQFTGVDEAWYSLEGDRAAFYGWLQFAAPDDPGPLPPPAPTPTETAPLPTIPPSAPTPQPSRSIPTGLPGTEWTDLPTTQPLIALTFDAGANADAVAPILATLADTGTPATFFLTGHWVTAYPSYAQAIGQRHTVGNHTQTHPDLTTLDDAAALAEIEGAGQAIADATGRDPHPWFRFPYGARDERTIQLANESGYGSVRWSIDTLGWKGTSAGITVQTVVERVLDDLHPGQIVLMHVGSHPTDGSTLDANALPEVIRLITAAGYRFVELDAFLD